MKEPDPARSGSGRRLSRRGTVWITAAAVVLISALIVVAVAWTQSIPGAVPAAGKSGEHATVPSTSSAPPSSQGGSASPKTNSPKPTNPASVVLPELKPKGLRASVTAPTGLKATITKLESVAGKAVAPGDVSGPAVRLTFTLRNTGSKPYDTAYLSITAYKNPGRVPVSALMKPGGSPFEGVIAPNASRTGVYIFSVPKADRDDVVFVLDYAAGKPAIVFAGKRGFRIRLRRESLQLKR